MVGWIGWTQVHLDRSTLAWFTLSITTNWGQSFRRRGSKGFWGCLVLIHSPSSPCRCSCYLSQPIWVLAWSHSVSSAGAKSQSAAPTARYVEHRESREAQVSEMLAELGQADTMGIVKAIYTGCAALKRWPARCLIYVCVISLVARTRYDGHCQSYLRWVHG